MNQEELTWVYMIGAVLLLTFLTLGSISVCYAIFDWIQRRKVEKNFRDYAKRTYPDNTKEPGKWPTDRT